MRVTIRDVAKECGVSPSTVSRVFNNKEGVSSETAENVLAVADRLGYEPRSYNKSEKNTNYQENIVILFNNQFSGEDFTLNPFYGNIIEGIEGFLNENNYNLFLKGLTGDKKIDLLTIDDFINDEKIAGLLLIGSGIDKEIILRIKDSETPVILVDNELLHENIDCVVNDNQSGARMIMKHLIDLGHRRIAFIGGPLNNIPFDERYVTYKQALKKAGIEKNDDWIKFCGHSIKPEYGYQIAKKILNNNEMPTAIFAAADTLAMGVIRAAHELGYSLPEDISIAGFDDINISAHIFPALTTIKVFKREMGIEAARRLLQLIDDTSLKPIKIVVSVELLVRESTTKIK